MWGRNISYMSFRRVVGNAALSVPLAEGGKIHMGNGMDESMPCEVVRTPHAPALTNNYTFGIQKAECACNAGKSYYNKGNKP